MKITLPEWINTKKAYEEESNNSVKKKEKWCKKNSNSIF